MTGVGDSGDTVNDENMYPGAVIVIVGTDTCASKIHGYGATKRTSKS